MIRSSGANYDKIIKPTITIKSSFPLVFHSALCLWSFLVTTVVSKNLVMKPYHSPYLQLRPTATNVRNPGFVEHQHVNFWLLANQIGRWLMTE
jgi:hypothetical protein